MHAKEGQNPCLLIGMMWTWRDTCPWWYHCPSIQFAPNLIFPPDITAKGLAKAHNFLLSFFKNSPATTVKVAGRDDGRTAQGSGGGLGMFSPGVVEGSGGSGSSNVKSVKPTGQLVPTIQSASRSGLLQYDVDDDGDDRDSGEMSVGSRGGLRGVPLQRNSPHLSDLSRNSSFSSLRSPSIRRLDTLAMQQSSLTRLSFGTDGRVTDDGSGRVSINGRLAAGQSHGGGNNILSSGEGDQQLPEIANLAVGSVSGSVTGSVTSSRRSVGPASMYGSVRFGDSVALPPICYSDNSSVGGDSPPRSPIHHQGDGSGAHLHHLHQYKGGAGPQAGLVPSLSRSSSRFSVNSSSFTAAQPQPRDSVSENHITQVLTVT